MRRNGAIAVARQRRFERRGTAAGSGAGRWPRSSDSAFSISSATVSLAERSRRVCHSCVTRARISASLAAQSRSVARPVARAHQLGDGALGVEDALALHLGRVRGEHRRDVGAAPASATISVGADAGPRRRSKVIASEPSCRCPCALVMLAPADVVAVLGEVGQVGEVAEGADHAHRLVAREVLQQPVERAAGARVASSAGRPPTAGGCARPARRPRRPPARGSRRPGCGRAGGCPPPAAGSSRRRPGPCGRAVRGIGGVLVV